MTNYLNEDTRLVFVYGSLLDGLHNNPVLRDSPLLMEWTTKPEYTLTDQGAFPAVVEGGTTAIKGELYAVSQDVWESIEYLEGYPHYYGRITLETPCGDAVMYTLDSTDRCAIVESGDWREYYTKQSVRA